MSDKDTIRAWKDKQYRQSLSEAERALLPENPAGDISLTDAEIDQVAGGSPTFLFTCFCPPTWWYTCWYHCTVKEFDTVDEGGAT